MNHFPHTNNHNLRSMFSYLYKNANQWYSSTKATYTLQLLITYKMAYSCFSAKKEI